MPETNNREVKADEEVIDADAIPDEGEDDPEEEVIPAVEEDEEAPESDQEPDDQTPDSSPEGDTPEVKEKPDAPLQKEKEPAPVVGETPREKALRIKVSDLRGQLHKKSIQDMIQGDEVPEK